MENNLFQRLKSWKNKANVAGFLDFIKQSDKTLSHYTRHKTNARLIKYFVQYFKFEEMWKGYLKFCETWNYQTIGKTTL